MRQRLFKAFEALLFIGLAGSFLFFVPLQKIIHAIQQASPVNFWVSCLLGLPVTYLVSMRLQMLIQRQAIKISTLKLFEINLVVRFYSFFSPASTLGSLMRWYKLSGDGKSTEALTAVTVNRLFEIFIAIVFGLFWVVGEINRQALIQPGIFILFLIAIILIWLIATRYGPVFFFKLGEKLGRHEQAWLRKIGLVLLRLAPSLRSYSIFSMSELLLLVVIGLSSEMLGLLAYVQLAMSLHIPISFINLGWMRSIFFLAALTPFTLVGGLGIREISVVLVLSAFGVNAELAAAFAFLLYVRSTIISLIGGMIEFISLIFGKRT